MSTAKFGVAAGGQLKVPAPRGWSAGWRATPRARACFMRFERLEVVVRKLQVERAEREAHKRARNYAGHGDGLLVSGEYGPCNMSSSRSVCARPKRSPGIACSKLGETAREAASPGRRPAREGARRRQAARPFAA